MADFSGEITADVWAPTTSYTAGRGGHKVEYIAVHHEASVGSSPYSIAAMWSANGFVSAHYSVDNGGAIAQHVYESDTAYAVGRWEENQRSISIEHANDNANPWTVSETTQESGAHLVAALLIKYGLGYPRWGGNVRPHNQIAATACPGELAGSQNAHYMERVCYWYEVMTGARSTSEVGWHTDGKGTTSMNLVGCSQAGSMLLGKDLRSVGGTSMTVELSKLISGLSTTEAGTC